MIKVIDNKIISYKLPRVGVLKDGKTVSGYHLLDKDILKEEGWLPLEDIIPKYNEETQYLIHDGYEILSDKVIKKYKIEDMSAVDTLPVHYELDLLKAQNKALSNRLDFSEELIAELAMKVYD